ncbi:hypothetical protein PV10_04284 [Exophiala mesophila]|uniref:Uncharacterized protein n=1 Tax=Exophiala mesophila TaxID=212818 RepID=A0A0D1ZGZ7_EXOME|nr:uncharacterized protein PV10_04284 [Exophiala mesophila]KIV93039.1 hypothetical protein PV10_04284 [Exophiala mesophila]
MTFRALQTSLHIRPRPGSSSMSVLIPVQTPPSRSLSGLYKPHQLKELHYGPGIVQEKLLSALPTESSRAFIVTGQSLATKTPLIKDLEKLLGSKHHAGTFSNIKEHAPIAQLDEATDQVQADQDIDTIISVGGGSPIDSSKAIIFRVHEKFSKWLTHITIPTTLSAAEATAMAGYTTASGVKTGIAHPKVYPSYIFYDVGYGLYTPPQLMLSTGLRALDHAIESQYHASASLPTRLISLGAVGELFTQLTKYKEDPKDEDTITRLFLAAFSSLGFMGQSLRGGLGLSHSLGYALGSPYGIPHGVTSGLTLGHVVKLMARKSPENAANIAKVLPYISEQSTGDAVKDADIVGDRILKLVKDLGVNTTLTEKGVGKDQVDIIVARATGGLTADKEKTAEEDALYTHVKALVEGLY